MVCFTAREPQYLDHLAPVWRAIPAERRGQFHVPPKLAGHALRRGVEPTVYEGDRPRWDGRGPIVVAATQDNRRARAARRPVVYMSHGNGQAFNRGAAMHKAYAGGPGRENVALFLSPNEYQAERWRRAYPHARTAVVGCPKLDHRPREQGVRPGPVCIAFHWDCKVAPEAGNAWPHFRGALADLADRFDLVAHAHPRIAAQLRPQFERLGIPYLADFEQVLDTCSVYVNDCSSTLYEFAAFGGPVVVMNAPTFRRGVRHGLRFWELADVGVQADDPAELAGAVERALQDPPAIAARRREISQIVYPVERAAAAAAAAILDLDEP